MINRFQNYKADVSVGRELIYDKLPRYSVNFLYPRASNSHIEQGVQAFKKYLFDSLSIYDLKQPIETSVSLPNFTRLSRSYRWIIDHKNLALMTPLIEISRNPIRFDHICCLPSRMRQGDLEQVRSVIIKKEPKHCDDLQIGRKRFIPNQRKIEIDITFDCNLKCIGCNRSCSQAPSSEMMSFKQIECFVSETIQRDTAWDYINILGGEPTLHPDFHAIIELLLNRLVAGPFPKTIIQITSNGLTHSREILNKLPRSPNIVIDKLSFKSNREVEYFTPFNLAPIDDTRFANAEFNRGCWVTAYCGIGLNKYGFYCCGIAGSIDRILGLNKGIGSLQKISDSLLQDQLSTFCRYCGNFSDYTINRGDFIPRCEKAALIGDLRSKSWQTAYREYGKHKRQLTEVYNTQRRSFVAAKR